MDKIGRLLLIGVAAGFILSIYGTVSRLVLAPFVAASASALKAHDFRSVLLAFFLDVVTGVLYVGAYYIFFGRNGTSWARRFLSFWAMLVLASVLPRIVTVYKYFAVTDKLVVVWAAAWLLEATLVAVLISLLYPFMTKVTTASHS